MRPEATPLDHDTCDDDLLGPAMGEVSAAFDYLFSYKSLEGDGKGFAERATSVWKRKGMKLTAIDSPGVFERYAVSDDGFQVSVIANEAIDQVSIGGSGPCVPPPD